MSSGVPIVLPTEVIDVIAQRIAEPVAQRVAETMIRPREPESQRYYSPHEAAEYLRCKVKRIYNLTSTGRLRARKEGGRLLFTREDLDALVEIG